MSEMGMLEVLGCLLYHGCLSTEFRVHQESFAFENSDPVCNLLLFVQNYFTLEYFYAISMIYPEPLNTLSESLEICYGSIFDDIQECYHNSAQNWTSCHDFWLSCESLLFDVVCHSPYLHVHIFSVI